MSSRKMMAAPVLALAMSGGGVALAHGPGDDNGHRPASSQISGGSTQLTLNSAAGQALSAAQITLAATSPATFAAPTFTFPISRGNVARNGDALIKQTGGLTLTKGSTTVSISDLVIRTERRHAQLYGEVTLPAKCGQATYCLPREAFVQLGRVNQLSTGNGSSSGSLVLSGFAAKLLNDLAGTRIAKGAPVLGSITISPTLAQASPPAGATGPTGSHEPHGPGDSHGPHGSDS